MTLDKLAGMMKNEFDQMGEKFERIGEKFKGIDDRFDNLETRMDNMEESITKQISSLRGDLILVVRKEDKKLNTLVNILKKKNILSDSDLKIIANIRVFPQVEIKA